MSDAVRVSREIVCPHPDATHPERYGSWREDSNGTHYLVRAEEYEESKAEHEAFKRLLRGEQYGCSTFIDEETTTYGYGELDDHGWFEFPLPAWAVRAPLIELKEKAAKWDAQATDSYEIWQEETP